MSFAKRRLGSILLVLGTPALLWSACSAPSKGALMLAISTDMQTPKDLSLVSVFVSTDGTPKFDYLGEVLPDGSVALPATLAVIEPDTLNAEVRIRIVGFQGANARVLRDVITTVPHEQTSLLRLPLSFLDDGSGTGPIPEDLIPNGATGVAEGDTTFDSMQIVSSCDFNQGQTSINGACVSATVDSSKLDPYDPADVYGAGGLQPNGAPVDCFDVANCFAKATPVGGLDASACSFALPPGVTGAGLNLALVTTQTGACTAVGQCLVPLENDPAQGWAQSGDTILMNAGVCKKVQNNGAKLYMAQGTCAPKLLSNPICEPGQGSNAEGEDGGASGADGTVGASDSGTSGKNPEAAAPLNPHGTVIVPNGAQGIAIVHIEDSNGALLATPSITSVAATGSVLFVAEPPDLSQGVVATTLALQTLDNATTTPFLTDDIPLSTLADGAAVGVPLSIGVFADSTFSSVEMSGVYSDFIVCFTGGLHIAQNQTLTPHAPLSTALNTSPDGTLIATMYSATIGFNTVVTMLSPHDIVYGSPFSFSGLPTPAVTARGAMAYEPTTSDTMLYAAPNGTLYAFTTLKTTGAMNSLALPGTPAGASVAYAPSGQYAIVATTSGLFTVSVDGTGTPVVLGGPFNPGYTGADGNAYTLSGAQSIAMTADGQYLVALTDQPSPESGTLVAMPVDASGNIGAVGLASGPFMATQNADVLAAY
jgi:hypothetical protein